MERIKLLSMGLPQPKGEPALAELSPQHVNFLHGLVRALEENLKDLYLTTGGIITGTVGTGIRKAKLTAAFTGDVATLTANLFDSDGNELSDTKTVYIFPSKQKPSEINGGDTLADYIPTLSDNREILVAQAKDTLWYMVRPTLMRIEAVTAITAMSIQSASDRIVLNNVAMTVIATGTSADTYLSATASCP